MNTETEMNEAIDRRIKLQKEIERLTLELEAQDYTIEYDLAYRWLDDMTSSFWFTVEATKMVLEPVMPKLLAAHKLIVAAQREVAAERDAHLKSLHA